MIALRGLGRTSGAAAAFGLGHASGPAAPFGQAWVSHEGARYVGLGRTVCNVVTHLAGSSARVRVAWLAHAVPTWPPPQTDNQAFCSVT